jgi:hypothetical protein
VKETGEEQKQAAPWNIRIVTCFIVCWSQEKAHPTFTDFSNG